MPTKHQISKVCVFFFFCNKFVLIGEISQEENDIKVL